MINGGRDYELAVSNEADISKQTELLALTDEQKKKVTDATLAFQAANTHRKDLAKALKSNYSSGKRCSKKSGGSSADVGVVEKNPERSGSEYW